MALALNKSNNENDTDLRMKSSLPMETPDLGPKEHFESNLKMLLRNHCFCFCLCYGHFWKLLPGDW